MANVNYVINYTIIRTLIICIYVLILLFPFCNNLNCRDNSAVRCPVHRVALPTELPYGGSALSLGQYGSHCTELPNTHMWLV